MHLAPDPDRLANITSRLEEANAQFGQRGGGTYAEGYLLGHLSSMFGDAARDHGPQCDGCEFCAFIVEGLSLIAALEIQHPDLAKSETWNDDQGR